MHRRNLIKMIPGGLLALFAGKTAVAKPIWSRQGEWTLYKQALKPGEVNELYSLETKLYEEYNDRIKQMRNHLVEKIDEFLGAKKNEALAAWKRGEEIPPYIRRDAHRIAQGEDFIYIKNKREQVQTWGESIGPFPKPVDAVNWPNYDWKCDDAIVYELSSGHKFIVREDPKYCTSTGRYFDTQAEWKDYDKNPDHWTGKQSQEEHDYEYALVECDAFQEFRKRGRNTPKFYQKHWDECHEYWKEQKVLHISTF